MLFRSGSDPGVQAGPCESLYGFPGSDAVGMIGWWAPSFVLWSVLSPHTESQQMFWTVEVPHLVDASGLPLSIGVQTVPITRRHTGGLPSEQWVGVQMSINTSVWPFAPGVAPAVWDPYGIEKFAGPATQYVYQGVLILHELAHVYELAADPNGILWLGGSAIKLDQLNPALSGANSLKIFNTCAAPLLGMGPL